LETKANFESVQPRCLRYRSHYKIYLVSLLVISGLILSFWGHQLSQARWVTVYSEFSSEMWLSLAYFVSFGGFYFLWLKSRLDRVVQVYPTHLSIHNHNKKEEVHFENVESVGFFLGSIFYFKMKDGIKHYFSSGLERVDYVFEGFNQARPGVIAPAQFEGFRTKLVQYDHHQKRKEWFFRHRIVDVFNWVIMPLAFLVFTFLIQSQEIVIHQQGMYFFRLFMYSVLVMMVTTLIFSIVLKKFVFDKRIKLQMHGQSNDKLRNLEFEGIIVHRSKVMQIITASFLFALVMRSEMNFYSLTKTKDDLTSFNLKKGHTLIVDNRYNCLTCKYPLKDGDIVVFGRGTIGQMMASEGDMVGQISQDKRGRIIASENIQEVPKGHVAIKLANQQEIIMIKLSDLIGKIQK
jgi:hypothetical protein